MQQEEVRMLLDNLERDIKRLRMEYNRFIANAPDVNIDFCEKRVTDLIKLLHKTTFKKYASKFRFENLVARFNILKINFHRMSGIREKNKEKVKDMLFGKGRDSLTGGKNLQQASPASGGNISGKKAGNAFRLFQPESQENDLEKFYERYVEMKTIYEGMVTLSYDDFVSRVSDRLEKAKKSGRGKELECKLVEENGKVKIKSKVVKK
ncbi:MAG: hypothetical protein GXO69_01935 [Acidobacteria bacterium]|nr:hypothetical protein [Acidobacteriota bacterium]